MAFYDTLSSSLAGHSPVNLEPPSISQFHNDSCLDMVGSQKQQLQNCKSRTGSIIEFRFYNLWELVEGN